MIFFLVACFVPHCVVNLPRHTSYFLFDKRFTLPFLVNCFFLEVFPIRKALFTTIEAQPVLFCVLCGIPDKWSLAIDRGHEYLPGSDSLSADNIELIHQITESNKQQQQSATVNNEQR